MEKFSIWNILIPIIFLAVFELLAFWRLIVLNTRKFKKSLTQHPRAFKTPRAVEDVFEDTNNHFHPKVNSKN